MNQEILWMDLKGVNCYLLKAGENFILVDTGGSIFMDKQFSNRRDILEKELENAGCRPGNLNLIIITHGDIDHIASAAYIRDKYQTQIAMHKEDVVLVDHPGMEEVMKSTRFESTLLKMVFRLLNKKIIASTQRSLNMYESFIPDILLDEGDCLAAYGLEATVLHIPGHTPGSIGILTPNGELIAGDIFMNTRKPGLAPNAWDFGILRKSVNRLKSMNIKRVYPGHGKPFEMVHLLDRDGIS